MDIKTLSTTIGHASVDVTLKTYSHVTDTMKSAAAATIDATMGKNKGKTVETARESSRIAKPTEQFEVNKGKKRKPGTGYIKQLSVNCWQGRYTPTIDGKRISKNVYAPTEEECEQKLNALIQEMQETIRSSKAQSQLII